LAASSLLHSGHEQLLNLEGYLESLRKYMDWYKKTYW